ncbi:MAG: NAD(+) diphosphatase [Candidatus Zhuqueibacterota bacterium]
MIEQTQNNFAPAKSPVPRPDSPGWWFIFHHYEMLVRNDERRVTIPKMTDAAAAGFNIIRSVYLGMLEGAPCFSAEIDAISDVPAQMEFRELRPLFGVLPEKLFWIAGRAFHILKWDEVTQFCGRCAAPFEFKLDEYAKICPVCGLVSYPPVVPAIIVAVSKGDHILLARAVRFKRPVFSVIAGFVEPGETLEACVQREIHEEVGIEVKNIAYFSSQPWPFPNSLMVAFTAEYSAGEIRIDENEIAEADWYSVDNLPTIPDPPSIARKMIDSFIRKLTSPEFRSA